MRRKYICKNGVVEVTQFCVGDNQGGDRKWRRAKSQEDKRDENARQAIRVAARILNCNFGPEDVLVTLTYDDAACGKLFAGMDQDQILDKAKRILSGKLEQVRKLLQGESGKNMSVTADIDGETGEAVRVHHHVVITRAAGELLRKKWNHGIAHEESLYRQDDYTPLAAYLLEQVRHRPGRKKYCCSRNMEKPLVEEQVLRDTPDNEIKVQPGARVIDRFYKAGEISQYVRYKRRPRAAKRGGHKMGQSDPDGRVMDGNIPETAGG